MYSSTSSPLVGERGGADHGDISLTEGVEDRASLGLWRAAGQGRGGDIVLAEFFSQVFAVINAGGEHQGSFAAGDALSGEVEEVERCELGVEQDARRARM